MHSFDALMNALRNNLLHDHQWHLHGKHPSFATRSLCSVHADKFWNDNRRFGDSSIVIAVADDGCMIDNFSNEYSDNIEGFAYIENGKLNLTKDKSKKNNIFSSKFKHGTAICGLIAAPISSVLPVGVAPGVKILPIRWPYDNGFIINQLGFQQFVMALSDKIDIFVNTWSKLPDFILNKESVEMISSFSSKGGRRGKGILFLWAAGNSNCPINYAGEQKIVYSCDANNKISYSSSFSNNLNAHDNVLVISAINSFFEKASYSCFGPGVDLCAPSNDLYLSEGENKYLGLTTLSADLNNFTHNFKGTSGACAIAAGVAALNLSVSMDQTANQLAYNLKLNALRDLDRKYEKYKCDVFYDNHKVKREFIFDLEKQDDEIFELFYGCGRINSLCF
ncbi:S8 family serine peptidase [Dickeya sp. CFBP 2040]|uniref:S8 family serine peptidase n=1 Tax=Dickeya sp. CFBP 2040 TaxID=2718531 RepID=UPI001447E9F5|nr:S8 family serine peptidase [Dickeya sp. CFBP 2040]NKI75621.1 S8 family serine peptidase [Dickeya sp. CFBP 2040]